MTLDIRAGSRTIELSREDKVLFPETGLTKADLARYYQQAAELILPHVKDRPISMHRYPNGINGKRFYQKKIPKHFPEWVSRVTVAQKGEGGKQDQVAVNNVETLIYLADQACVTPHTWLSRGDKLETPDRMIFDF